MNEITQNELTQCKTIQEAIVWFKGELSGGKCSPDCIQCNANELALQALQEKAKRENMRCENCSHIRFNDNFHWCGCTAGLDGNRKLTDFCSYFKPKENENG